MVSPAYDLQASFATTQWTVVLAARDRSGTAADEALGYLCQTYWPPLYAFLRRQGYKPQDCEDLVQGFFERLIAREFLRDVNWEKGRFRSFLLAALRHYVANARRNGRTQRRGGQYSIFSLNEPSVLEWCEAASVGESNADLVFDRVWAATIMNNAVRALRREYATSGRASLYAFLNIWLAREARSGEYASAASAAGMTEGGLAAAVFRMRRRFRELVREEVAHTVQTSVEIDVEMRHLFRVLAA